MADDDVEAALADAKSPRRRAAVAAIGIGIALAAFAGYFRWRGSHLHGIVGHLSGRGCRPKVYYQYGEPPSLKRVEVGGAEVGVRLPMTTREVRVTRTGLFELHAVGSRCSEIECRIVADGREVFRRRGAHEAECTLWEARKAGRWP